MSEPTLALKLTEIQAKLGTFAGWGRGEVYGETAWTSYQQAVIDDATQSGLRRFYYPTAVEGESQPYDWSFLRPTATIYLALGAQTVPLPDDFGGLVGQITVNTTPPLAQPWLIEWTNSSRLRGMYSLTPSITGPPMYVSLDPLKGTTGISGQRWQLLIYPIADQAYTLNTTYYVNPDYLSGACPYAYGGPEHVETILESCLAVMEERLDDMNGPHHLAFGRRLVASIGMDRKKKPQKIGPNRDRSDGYGWRLGDQHWWAAAATYNNMPFDN